MKTLKEIKAVLTYSDGKNTATGMHINSLLNKDLDTNCALHNLEIAIEIFSQMSKNGIDVFKDSFKMGSISKAYYQVKLKEYQEYK